MASLIVNIIIGFWLLLFGAMALFPLMLGSKNEQPRTASQQEDRVISIRPVAPAVSRRPRPIVQPTPVALEAHASQQDEHQPRHAA